MVSKRIEGARSDIRNRCPSLLLGWRKGDWFWNRKFREASLELALALKIPGQVCSLTLVLRNSSVAEQMLVLGPGSCPSFTGW